MQIQDIAPQVQEIRENMEKVMVGKRDVIELVLTSLLAGGHVLLEDVPGTGKTVLAKSLAKSLEGDFKRIQFTPDLLPTDVTGLSYYNQKEQEFIFREGPVFANIVLADEINRATPRTQSSLLECMEERQITIDGETRMLEKLFFVIATENRIETVGTFPLPEAQLDRFMMKLSVGFPNESEELHMLQRFLTDNPLDVLQPVCSKEAMVGMEEQVRHVFVHELVQKYLLDVVRATRTSERVLSGVSPRGSLALLRCCQAYAAIQGRTYVIPEDVKYLAPYVLGHRIVPLASYEEEVNGSRLVGQMMENIAVPTENFKGN